MSVRISLNKISVLVIDDNLFMRSLLRAVLQGLGCGVVHLAEDGRIGMERLLKYRPDIVICDWVMAPVNGADFIKRLRKDKDQAVATTPVIMLTSFNKRAYVVQAARLGANEFLAKPVSPTQLYQRIERIVTETRPFVRVPGYFGPMPRGAEPDSKTLAKIAAVMATPLPRTSTLF
ncbi:response regulator [Breoghania sp. L-A4]|uniref:response regulator n=1 Tax=Breoghania sp. L-A4 TaxID=2304600 RepID=UPI0013C2EC7B|nr:response regulator [Breoghania sp. L-A4]